MCLILVLSGINNLKLVRFFKLILQYHYSIVLYVSGVHNAVVLCICVRICECLATLIQTQLCYSKAQLVQYNAEKVRGQ